MSIGLHEVQDPPERWPEIMPIKGTDHLELIVGNALQAAYFYMHVFGFEPLAYSGMRTGRKDAESYVVQQGKIRLVFTSALSPDSNLLHHHRIHGDGVKRIALWVDDAAEAHEGAIERGAVSCLLPAEYADDLGQVVLSAISTYGETEHLFVERDHYHGAFLPGYQPWKLSAFTSRPVGLQHIDHLVGNVELGQMDQWVKFYEEVMGFTQLITFDDADISTEYTALMSKVMSNGNGRIKFPINEPAPGLKKSQIEEYLEYNGGAGVQHIAVATNDIVSTVSTLRARGIEFLHVPKTYYDDLRSRVGDIDEELSALRELGILVDRDEEGYLLQIFTKPVQPRPTLFFEIIQRKGATSFGKGNFKALFEAIEREQALRGTL
ncbi:MAG: 4-hydroxyphenylpyruvate dioxygenase [Saprospiraceae bacterium]|nr:4-hydroxyphenylpyruvate dioxygenase [Saprospiraceae bacterium]